MHQPDLAARREQARLLYVESDLTLKQIAARLDIAKGSVSAWATRYDWPRRSPDHYSRAPLTTPSVPPAPPDTSPDRIDPGAGHAAVDDTATAPTPVPAVAKRRMIRRRKRPPIKNIVDRLYHIINHNLELMETRMSDDDQPANDRNPERDMRAVSSVVRSVDKLKEIEPEQSKRTNGSTAGSRYPLSPEEEDRLRKDIIARILKLRERS